ncbi:MAG: peptidylprolyl isomerase [Polyangiaceae bacterium]|nr:peptidylprolyl isomerase [Polyangiaceae bacterium]
MRLALVLAAAASLCACSDSKPNAGAASASASGVALAPEPPPEARARIEALREAEHRRAPAGVLEVDLASRVVEVRRAAGRALSRIGGPSVRPMLLRLLGDDDAEVVTWAAYGLGLECADVRDVTADALVARSMSLPDTDAYDGAFLAIARSVGSCASPTRSEATLVAWLSAKPVRARAVAHALGDFASRTKRLREESWVSLFARAAGGVSEPPLPEALYPVSRVENVPPSVVDRLAEVASARLGEPGPARLFVIRALARAKAGGLAGVERVLFAEAGAFTVPERVEAARAAARLGADGQTLLGRALARAAEKPPAGATEDAAVLLATLAAAAPASSADPALAALASLEPASGASARDRRVVSLVRCAAARLTSGVKPETPALAKCDLDAGWIGKRATAEVLGRAPLGPRELATFKLLVEDPDARVRQAALELLSAHPEIPAPHTRIAAALAAKEPGVATVAAEQIKKAPALASAPLAAAKKKKKKPTPSDPPPVEDEPASAPPAKEVVDALIQALARAEKEHDPELLGAVIEAIGALGDKALLPAVQPFCASIHPTAREHATNAMALLSGRRPTCVAPDRADALAPEVTAPLTKTARITFDTDAGTLSIDLDPALAPVAGARFVALANRGGYDGNVLHRVDPSFVVQFGSPFADGYGGPTDLPPLRCETSPRPFDTLDVGVALSGRDTGSSQLFVMRARHPHLDGSYAIVGRASGSWDLVFEGDVIHKASVSDP